MPITRRLFFSLLAASFLAAVMPGASKAGDGNRYLLYVGTYTTKESRGIYAYRYDAGSGATIPLGLAAESENPSFLAIHPNRRFLYAVNELERYRGQSSGAVSAFAIDSATGRLKLLNTLPSSGADPCYLALDRTGKHLLVANYTGGSVAVFPLQGDGSLGEASAFVQHTGSSVNRERQEGPHAHWMETSPDNRFALATDLGLDEVIVYRFDAAKGTVTPSDPPFAKLNAGAGPRHFAFHPNGNYGYLVNELQSTVTVFSYQAGALHELQTVSTLPSDFRGKNDAAEIEVDPSGRFLYTSNRGDDSIALFAIDPAKGMLTAVGFTNAGGKTPRNFTLDPTGTRLFVANQDSGNIVVFAIDQKNGRLMPTGRVLTVPSPVCLKFVTME
ncbi:MAG TPA: lactonase family protein [Terriglobales bacterium]|nr:lactonase family protein [Terriglobales bacterium]